MAWVRIAFHVLIACIITTMVVQVTWYSEVEVGKGSDGTLHEREGTFEDVERLLPPTFDSGVAAMSSRLEKDSSMSSSKVLPWERPAKWRKINVPSSDERGAGPHDLFAYKGQVLFRASSGFDYGPTQFQDEVWLYDGGDQARILVRVDKFTRKFVEFKGKVYFPGVDRSGISKENGYEPQWSVWEYDGSGEASALITFGRLFRVSELRASWHYLFIPVSDGHNSWQYSMWVYDGMEEPRVLHEVLEVSLYVVGPQVFEYHGYEKNMDEIVALDEDLNPLQPMKFPMPKEDDGVDNGFRFVEKQEALYIWGTCALWRVQPGETSVTLLDVFVSWDPLLMWEQEGALYLLYEDKTSEPGEPKHLARYDVNGKIVIDTVGFPSLAFPNKWMGGPDVIQGHPSFSVLCVRVRTSAIGKFDNVPYEVHGFNIRVFPGAESWSDCFGHIVEAREGMLYSGVREGEWALWLQETTTEES